MGPIAKSLSDKLTEAFQPTRLELIDDSEKHRGHAGHREGGESHFSLTIESAVFAAMTRVSRQRAVLRGVEGGTGRAGSRPVG